MEFRVEAPGCERLWKPRLMPYKRARSMDSSFWNQHVTTMIFYVLLALMILSTVIQETAAVCENGYFGEHCEGLKEWCTSSDPEHSSFMKSNCKKTCGFCCEDGYFAEYCEGLKDWCTSTDPEHLSFMKSNCKKTCGFCCEDGYFAEYCEGLKDWCTSTDPEHSSFMKSNCKKTCGFCKE